MFSTHKHTETHTFHALPQLLSTFVHIASVRFLTIHHACASIWALSWSLLLRGLICWSLVTLVPWPNLPRIVAPHHGVGIRRAVWHGTIRAVGGLGWWRRILGIGWGRYGGWRRGWGLVRGRRTLRGRLRGCRRRGLGGIAGGLIFHHRHGRGLKEREREGE